jgi:hypothetical protein
MAVRRLVASCALLGAVACARPAAAASVATQPAPPTPVAEPLHRRIKVSVGFHYSSGDYGTSESTEIFYVPLVIRAELGRAALQATIPYLRIDGPAGIIEGPAGPIDSSGEGDGLGDLFARGSYLLPRRSAWPSWVPFVDVAGVVKFPTASRGDGLGTGEFDFGLESDLTWGLGRLTPFASVGYRFLGDPPGADLDDVFGFAAGAQVRILPPLAAGVLLDYREASSAATGERLELVPFASWTFTRPWSIEAYVSAGLASGSPDAGVGVQIGRSW